MRFIAILSTLTFLWSLILLPLSLFISSAASPHLLLTLLLTSALVLLIIHPRLPDRPPGPDDGMT